MRKVWAKLGSLVLVLFVMVSFTACSLFTDNLDKRYSATVTVASAANAEKVSISRKDLYYAYIEWGYQYANYYEDANDLLEFITNTLLNEKIMQEISIQKFGALYEAEKALARKQAFDAMDRTIRAYIYEALDLDDTADKNDTDTSDSNVSYQPYTKTINVTMQDHQVVGTLNLDSYQDEAGDGLLVLDNYLRYRPAVPGVASDDNIVRKAVSKVVRNLQSLENGFTNLVEPTGDSAYLDVESPYFKNPYLDDSQRAVLNREIDRMVKSNETSILVSRMNTAYQLGLIVFEGDAAKNAWKSYLERSQNWEAWVESINGTIVDANGSRDGTGRSVATNIANKAVDYYLEKVTDSIYNTKNFPDANLEKTLMSAKLEDVYYVPADVAKNLFTVSHILIGFTDEQKEEYKRIQAEDNPSFDKQAALDNLCAAVTSNGKTAHEIYLELTTALNKADNLDDKYTIFRDFIYKYNTDPGMQNPTYEYLMSKNPDNNNMIQAFTDASVTLFNQGVKGAISGIVLGDYGAHIIMYTRDLADFVYTGAKGLESTSVELLRANYPKSLFAPLTAYGNKTRFDTIVEAYFTRTYNSYRNMLLNEFKNEHEITIVNGEFKNFLKS